MPEDRLLHPCQGHSAKVSALTHLEYRVWTQYLLCADDYGVMLDSVSVLKGANLALDREPEDAIRAAIERLLSLFLVYRFEHQGQSYLYSREWQDFQKVIYPRKSYLPSPISEMLQECSEKTREAFREKLKAKGPHPHRLKAKGLRLKADPDGESEGEGGINGREVRAFSDAFVALYAKHLHGAKYHWRGAQDTGLAKSLLATYGHERLVKLAEGMLTTDEAWVADTDRGMGVLNVRASWLDCRLATWEATHGPR